MRHMRLVSGERIRVRDIGDTETCQGAHLDVGRVCGAREVGVDLLQVALGVPAPAIINIIPSIIHSNL